MLQEDKMHVVIDIITKLRSPSSSVNDLRQKVLNYYEINIDRILCKTYRNKGLCIGSG